MSTKRSMLVPQLTTDDVVRHILQELEKLYEERAEELMYMGKYKRYKDPKRVRRETIKRLRFGVEGALQWA